MSRPSSSTFRSASILRRCGQSGQLPGRTDGGQSQRAFSSTSDTAFISPCSSQAATG